MEHKLESNSLDGGWHQSVMLNIPIQVGTVSDYFSNEIRFVQGGLFYQFLDLIVYSILDCILPEGNFLFVFLDPVQLL